MLIYAKLLNGELIPLDIQTVDEISHRLHQIDPIQFPIHYTKIINDPSSPLTDGDLVPVLIDVDPMIRQINVYMNIKDKIVKGFDLCLEFDLKNAIEVLTYTDHHPKRNNKLIQKNDMTEEEWDQGIQCLKKSAHTDKERKCMLTISCENNNTIKNVQTNTYKVSVKPFVSHMYYTHKESKGNDLSLLLSQEFGVFFEYEMLKEMYSPYSFDQSRIVYKLISFRFKDYVLTTILDMFEKTLENAIDRPYMYSYDIYKDMMNDVDNVYIDYFLYTEVLYEIDPRTILHIEMDVYQKDNDPRVYSPLYTKKRACVITKNDPFYKILWCESFETKTSYDPYKITEIVLDPTDCEEAHFNKDVSDLYEKNIRRFIETYKDPRLKYGYIKYYSN